MKKNKMENAVRFYILATQLKYKIRSGWDNHHWNIKGRKESVAEHIYGTCILAISIYSEFNPDVDLSKVLKMLVLHEIGEVVIGDITPYDNITLEEKFKIEHDAIAKIVDGMAMQDEIISLLNEFDGHETKESVFAFYCDKLEANLQSKVYQDKGCHHSLNDQNNNKIMNSEKIKNIIASGAQTPFDVWYKSDKEIFKNDVVFSQFLDYVKMHNTNNFIKIK